MRKLAIVMALASTALAAPATAADGTWYAGVEGGLMKVEDVKFEARADNPAALRSTFELVHNKGVDLDLIGGYDFGMIRAEVEAGYKRASLDEIKLYRGAVDADGSARVYSAMANLLVDFGGDDGWNGYFGGGLGVASARYKINYLIGTAPASGSDSDRSIAVQAIAGIRAPVSDNVDVGVKYRFFVAPDLEYNIDGGEADATFRSHSLLASLIFNFGGPVLVPPPPLPPAPPPPPPIATQTCPDGSVIAVTDACPLPPAPPPPATPERG